MAQPQVSKRSQSQSLPTKGKMTMILTDLLKVTEDLKQLSQL
jgi:hypothetical protein